MDRNAWIAILLIGLVLILTPYLEKLWAPTPVPPPPVTQSHDTIPAAKPPAETGVRADTSAITSTTTPLVPPVVEKPWFKQIADPAKGVTTIVTPLYTAVLGWDGARFLHWKLHPNGKYIKDTVETVRKDEGYSIAPGLQFRDGGMRTVEFVQFTSTDSLIKLSENDTRTVTLHGAVEPFGNVELLYTFKGGSFEFEITARYQAEKLTTLGESGVWSISPGLSPTEDVHSTAISSMTQTGEEYFVGSHVWLGEYSNGTHEEFAPSADKPEKFNASGTTQWVAQRSKYFVVAVSPKKPGTAVEMSSEIGLNPTWKTQRILVTVPTTAMAEFSTRVYWGPLKNSYVGAFAPKLDLIMNWGWAIIRPFSKAVLWTLTFLYQFVPNYGIVILLFTILIKVILWPLTAKQFRSMKEMQIIQPIMQEMREKYKDNPKKMQEEMFKIYAEYKVNPAAGCLPMLLQMPVLYSLFIVFRSTIELRGAPFMLWIQDLSQPEALFILPFSIPLYGVNVALLPILMGVTQFYMGKQTASNDPNQKIMLYMMPVMMAVFFNSLPSGLVLYYFYYNLATIVQQHYIKGTTDKKVPEVKVS
ncbi:MAG: membrane protein insertase YidC [bacterium]|nr:membrane protein insertase YidC [bacterium]